MQVTSEGSNGHPTWSPDGQKIVYSSRRNGSTQIYTMDANGQNKRQLTQGGNHSAAVLGPVSPIGVFGLGFSQTLCYIDFRDGRPRFSRPADGPKEKE